VAILAPYFAEAGKTAAVKAGDAAVDGIRALASMIRRKFEDDGDDYAKETLSRLENKPDDQGRQAALQGVIAEKAEADPAFAAEVERLVQEATNGKPLNQFLTQVFGGEVRNIVNIGTADQVDIG
jgi:hypothetical protein